MEKIITTLPHVNISLESLLAVLRVDREFDLFDSITAMHQAAMEVAKPIALYAAITPELKNGEIWLNNVRFEEKFIYDMLLGSKVVVPYVASCGIEIEAWSESFTDMYERFIADTLKRLCLYTIREKLLDEVKERYFNPEKNISSINPGSLEDWPITGQIPLFNLLGDVKNDIGVVLSDSLLMLPGKSSSGIFFQTEKAYENCQLCPRTNCPSRKKAYAGD